MSKKSITPNSSFAKTLSNELNNKHKIDARKNDIVEADTKNTKKDEVKNDVKIDKFNPELKHEALNKKTLLSRFLFGLTFGISSFFPTLSASSTSSYKIFDDFKEKMYCFFKPGNFYNWLLYTLWLLPVFVMSIFSFIITFVIVYFISQSNYGPGILLGSAGVCIVMPFIYFLVKKLKLPVNKSLKEFYTNNGYRKWLPFVIISICVIFVVVIAILGRFVWNDDYGYILDGVSFANPNQINAWLNQSNSTYNQIQLWKQPNTQFQTSDGLLLIVSGFFAGFVAFVPGLSSGKFLILFGVFNKTLLSTEVAFNNSILNWSKQADAASWAWPNIIVVFAGYCLGIVANVFFNRFLENKNKRLMEFAYFGFIIGSAIANFIIISPVDYYVFANNNNVLALGLSLFFLTICLSFLTFVLLHNFKIIHLHDKLNFKKTSINA